MEVWRGVPTSAAATDQIQTAMISSADCRSVKSKMLFWIKCLNLCWVAMTVIPRAKQLFWDKSLSQVVLVAIGSKPNGAAIVKRVPWMHHSQIQNQEGCCVCVHKEVKCITHTGETPFIHM